MRHTPYTLRYLIQNRERRARHAAAPLTFIIQVRLPTTFISNLQSNARAWIAFPVAFAARRTPMSPAMALTRLRENEQPFRDCRCPTTEYSHTMRPATAAPPWSRDVAAAACVGGLCARPPGGRAGPSHGRSRAVWTHSYDSSSLYIDNGSDSPPGSSMVVAQSALPDSRHGSAHVRPRVSPAPFLGFVTATCALD